LRDVIAGCGWLGVVGSWTFRGVMSGFAVF